MDLEVKLSRSGTRADTGLSLPIVLSQPVAEEVITVSGVTAATVAAPADKTATAHVWMLKPVGGNCRVAFGASPTASASTGWHLTDGNWFSIGVSEVSETLSVIAAS